MQLMIPSLLIYWFISEMCYIGFQWHCMCCIFKIKCTKYDWSFFNQA